MDTLVKNFVTSLQNVGVITEREAKLCIYGAKNLLLMCINYVSIFVIAALLGNSLFSIFFLLAFIVIRTYAGGVHAKSALSCYIVSVLIFTGYLWLVQILVDYEWFSQCMIAAAAAGGAVIYKMAPVSTGKRDVTETERDYFRNVVRRNLFFVGVVDIVLYLNHFHSFVAAVSGAILLAALLLIVPQKEIGI